MSTKATMSGWSMRIIPMFAPRRNAPCWIASVTDESMRRKRAGRPSPPDDFTIGAPDSREVDAGAAARALDERDLTRRLHDVRDGVFEGQYEAGREHPEAPAGVHQRRRVRHEEALGHLPVEGVLDLLRRLRRRAPLRLARRDVFRDSTEELRGRLDDLALVVAVQVPVLENGQRVLRKTDVVRRHRIRSGRRRLNHDPSPFTSARTGSDDPLVVRQPSRRPSPSRRRARAA
jgi:hypothetical protein